MPGENEHELIIGLGEGIEELLNELPADTADLGVSGFLADNDITIVGLQIENGGETKTNQRGEEYVTRDQLVIHVRIDDVDMENPFSTMRYTLPEKRTDAQGRVTRPAPKADSVYGIFLATFEGLGVSRNESVASAFVLANGLKDLIGMRVHVQAKSFDLGRRRDGTGNNTVNVRVPTIVYGFDNEIRAQAGMPAAYLIGEEPAPVVAPKPAAPAVRRVAPAASPAKPAGEVA